MLFDQRLDDLDAQRQDGPLRPSHPCAVDSVGVGDRDVLLFGAVLIPVGEGACAWPDGSAYPHYCSLLTRVDSAEADRLVAERFRFCAYVGPAIDEGVRHYRATAGALKFPRPFFA
jgi:hypothetical protein